MIRTLLSHEILDVDIDAPDSGSSPPGQAKTPASPASEGGADKRTNYTRNVGSLRGFVNVRRRLRDWARDADTAYRLGHEIDLGPLRHHSNVCLQFRRKFGISLSNPLVSCLLNPLLRRGDFKGIRRFARNEQQRDLLRSALCEAGRQPEESHGLRN